MATLTTLEEKLADDEAIAATLQEMREEAAETERRVADVADARDGKKTAILEKARETKGEADAIQERHFAAAKEGSLELAGAKAPAADS